MRFTQVVAVSLVSIFVFNSVSIAANSKKEDSGCHRGSSSRDCRDMKISASTNDCPAKPHRGSGRKECTTPKKIG